MQLATILTNLNVVNLSDSAKLSPEEFQLLRIQAYNDEIGVLTGYDCKLCKNKGYLMALLDGIERVEECKCMKARKEYWHLEASGLKKQVEEKRFDNFEATDLWQARIKKIAEKFCLSSALMFFIGGQSGCGKSHICIAIVGELLRNLQQVRFMSWREDSVKLKGLVISDKYEAEIDFLKTVDVLYIDDFWKTKEVTSADINLAFEILNYRYNNSLRTIISTERHTSEILKIDEAVGSRITEMSKGYRLNIERKPGRNYRLKGDETI